MGNYAQKPLRGLGDVRVKIIAYSLPLSPLATHFFPGGLKDLTAQLLHLIHEKGQKHQVHEPRAQMFLAQAVVVAEVIALVLKGV